MTPEPKRRRIATEATDMTTSILDSNDSINGSEIKQTKISLKEHNSKTSTGKWSPISVDSTTLLGSTTYHSKIPGQILENPSATVVLGIDEAGRGPVLGPMVYGLAYALKEQSLPGFDDSKVLKDVKRKELFQDIDSFNLGWATRTMTARDISSGMLRSSLGDGAYNLNAQAHDTTIQLIKEVLASGVNVKEIYVDTVGPPVTYQNKLKGHFPGIEITVAKKADSLFPIVSAASVVAKVTRDINLELYASKYLEGQPIGSGYPSDPNTSKWLHANVDPVFGWLGLVRFSWQTAKDSLKNHKGVEVISEEEMISSHMDVSSYFGPRSSHAKDSKTSTAHVSLNMKTSKVRSYQKGFYLDEVDL